MTTPQKTRAERQAIDRAALKCWCGNVAGVGQTLCGRHRDAAPEPQETVPNATVEALADNIRKLLALKNQEKATMAKMIRWCVFWQRVDPTTYQLPGHEAFHDRQRKIKENRENKKKALLYLEWLATKLEDDSMSDNPTQSTEGEAPCISE